MHFATRLALTEPCRAPVAADDRPALVRKIAILEARVAELETALKQSQSQSQSQSHAVSVSQSRKNKTATTHTTAKLKYDPWKAAGVSRATYYRRKAAGLI